MVQLTISIHGDGEKLFTLPHWAVGSLNASNTLLKFRITTDNTVNQGGAAIDDWEGIMIDDLTVFSGAGSQNPITTLLDNFTDNSDHYLVNVSGYPNEWQHIGSKDSTVHGPHSISEEVPRTSSGWRIDHARGSTGREE